MDKLTEMSDGYKVKDFTWLYYLRDTIAVEKLNNLTLASLISEEIYEKAKKIVEDNEGYVFGEQGWNKTENVQLKKLFSGVLLQNVIDKFSDALKNAKQPRFVGEELLFYSKKPSSYKSTFFLSARNHSPRVPKNPKHKRCVFGPKSRGICIDGRNRNCGQSMENRK
ncbi:hypothetical protein L596_015917 [Steinernema carpocapsae]|uniref:Uncharacterized protein n=1 Tax=Steinernema carpocapsae TaxID=34508 RepID=A0A4U5NGE3_STECR|nr:hypothetical protein L596_015917 [Steinernema carpocapsae]